MDVLTVAALWSGYKLTVYFMWFVFTLCGCIAEGVRLANPPDDKSKLDLLTIPVTTLLINVLMAIWPLSILGWILVRIIIHAAYKVPQEK